MTRKKMGSILAVLAIGGIPLVTSATCDPVTGVLDIFRDDDYYDYYYDDVYFVEDYGDCYPFYCY